MIMMGDDDRKGRIYANQNDKTRKSGSQLLVADSAVLGLLCFIFRSPPNLVQIRAV
jgi:hypothetical protein